MVSSVLGQKREDTAESEAALVRGMLEGSRQAWSTFHARYDRLIRHSIGRVTGRSGRQLGPDEIAEIHATFQVQLCTGDMGKLRSFDPERGKRLSSWIAMLAMHCAQDHLRALRREPRRASLDECEEMGTLAPLPDEALDIKERVRIVDEILQDLSERDQELVTLLFVEGLDVEAIAGRMGISVKTVYSKKHKIQARIEARIAWLRTRDERASRRTSPALHRMAA
jgi:RNA polymerase sigma-70 factor (ECF subfamily)